MRYRVLIATGFLMLLAFAGMIQPAGAEPVTIRRTVTAVASDSQGSGAAGQPFGVLTQNTVLQLTEERSGSELTSTATLTWTVAGTLFVGGNFINIHCTNSVTSSLELAATPREITLAVHLPPECPQMLGADIDLVWKIEHPGEGDRGERSYAAAVSGEMRISGGLQSTSILVDAPGRVVTTFRRVD